MCYTYLTCLFLGDYGLDQIYPNEDVCPRLSTLETSIYNTPDWIAYNTSSQMQQLTKDLDNILGEGYWSWYYIFDCFMTTVCTGKILIFLLFLFTISNILLSLE